MIGPLITRISIPKVPDYRQGRIDAMMVERSEGHKHCNHEKNGYFNLYLNPELMKHENFDCMASCIKLHYDNETHLTYTPGVQTRIPEFGSVEGVEYVDSERVNFGK